jgi:hypothetical protein
MKKPRTSEAMFFVTNKYALVEEATIDTREQKEKESGHTDQPSSSKGHDKKRSGSFCQCSGTATTQQGVPTQAE